MDNRHRGFKCGEEMRDSVQERKFGHRLMRGWGCHLIVFTHLALVVECLDPSGLLCCKNLLGQVKGQRERSDCCNSCSVPCSYYVSWGLVAREMILQYIVIWSILCQVWFNLQSWLGKIYREIFSMWISQKISMWISQKKFPKPNVKLQISLTLVSMITLGNSNSFKGKGIHPVSRGHSREVSLMCIPNVLIAIVDDALGK